MLSFLLAAAAAPARVSTDPDLRCMAGYLIVAGDSQQGPTMSAEDRAGVQSLIMYYFGKLDARRPGADLEGEIRALVQSPAYAGQLKPDLERCNVEATARGRYLETFGDGQSPPAPTATSPKP